MRRASADAATRRSATPGGTRAATLLIALGLAACGPSSGERTNVLTAHGEPEVVVMDFARPMSLDPLPPGWHHRTFWTRGPMALSFVVKDGVPALRLATHGTASMLFRHVDVELAAYPMLTWRWLIEQPIDSAIDERTRAGDDHPARLFLSFRTAAGDPRNMEIVWGNRLHRGDYKYIGTFPHYVADGGNENVGRWQRETVDLAAIYRTIWPDAAPAHLYEVALFCDSDDTGGTTVSYVADVALKH